MLCCCMYIPGFIVTSADIIKPVMGMFMLFTNVLPEAICCCLQTCNVYGVWVTHISWSFVLTSASYT